MSLIQKLNVGLRSQPNIEFIAVFQSPEMS
jgi:hypothetical protein